MRRFPSTFPQISQAEFRKKFGQLQYLEHLRSSDYGRGGGGENPEPCPICRQALGTQWSVLQVMRMN